MPTRRVLLVDDEVTVLLTMKAVLEISGFNVDTAASAREGKSKIRQREYQMVITDMRMESDAAGREVLQAARNAPYHPAVALLTAYPMSGEDWQDGAPDKMLVKPMQTAMLLRQLEQLLEKHSAKLARLSSAAAPAAEKPAAKKSAAKKSSAKQPMKKTVAKKSSAAKPGPRTTKKTAKKAAKKSPAPPAAKKAAKKK